MRIFLLFVATLSILWGAAATSHHSPWAKFDFRQTVTLEGVITAFELKNPHAMLELDVANEAGEIESWEIEMAGKLSLSRRGWTDGTVSPGDSVSVTGNPAVSGRSEIWWNSLTLGDGTKFVEPTTEDSNTIDERRRQRAREQAR